MLRSDRFRSELLDQLRAEGFEVDRIIDYLPPHEVTDCGEVLWVDSNGRAATGLYDGTRIVMVIPGFGI